MIRFEIKNEVVEWLEQEYIGEPDATELIEGLMGLMIAHNCISAEQPAPAAALVEALRVAADDLQMASALLDNHGLHEMADRLFAKSEAIRAALASVEAAKEAVK